MNVYLATDATGKPIAVLVGDRQMFDFSLNRDDGTCGYLLVRFADDSARDNFLLQKEAEGVEIIL